jgi:hypothetical protein
MVAILEKADDRRKEREKHDEERERGQSRLRGHFQGPFFVRKMLPVFLVGNEEGAERRQDRKYRPY